MPRKFVARDHREAYDLWATHFDAPALMANRDAETNRRKIENVVRQLPLEQARRVLDVGSGDAGSC
jgi:cyclopropane fatty-acyl-phospholipid synthase-like methyltransferase